MNKEVFLISDASYSSKLKRAGIAVVNKKTKKEYLKTFSNVESSTEAEFVALVCAVTIAIKNGYKRPTFVYDCKSLILKNLKACIKNKFIEYRFEFFCREFVIEADIAAKKALLHSKNLIDLQELINTPNKKRTDLIQEFTSYSYTQIIEKSMHITSKEGKKLLETFLEGNYDLCKLSVNSNNDIDVFKFIYQMIPEKKRAFWAFILATNNISADRLKRRMSKVQCEKKILLINEKSKNKKAS